VDVDGNAAGSRGSELSHSLFASHDDKKDYSAITEHSDQSNDHLFTWIIDMGDLSGMDDELLVQGTSL
jgi:hypothetical protein